jgi:cell division protease FtsH
MARRILVWAGVATVAFLALVAFFNLLNWSAPRQPQQNLAFSELLNHLKRGELEEVTLAGSSITGRLTDGQSFASYAPASSDLADRLVQARVKVFAAPAEELVPSLFSILVSWIPLLIWFLALWLFVARPLRAMLVAIGRLEARFREFAIHGGAPVARRPD